MWIVFRRSGMPTFNSASDIVFRRFGNAGVPAVTAFRRFGMPSREMIRRRPLALNCVAVCLGASGHHTSRPHIRSQTCFPPLEVQVQDRNQQFSLVTLAADPEETHPLAETRPLAWTSDCSCHRPQIQHRLCLPFMTD